MVKDDTSIKSEDTIYDIETSKLVKKIITSQRHRLYENPDHAALMECCIAFRFLDTPLTPGSVIFKLPKKLFANRTDAYKLIENEIGPVANKIFIPLSDRYTSTDFLIINTKFCTEEATKKAVSTGLKIEGKQYTALLYKDKLQLNDVTKMEISCVPIEEDDNVLVEKLTSALCNYGKVMLITRNSCNGYFDGNVTVDLDRNNSSRNWPPLPNRMYFKCWDNFLTATYKSYPQVCKCCYESGHFHKYCDKKYNR